MICVRLLHFELASLESEIGWIMRSGEMVGAEDCGFCENYERSEAYSTISSTCLGLRLRNPSQVLSCTRDHHHHHHKSRAAPGLPRSADLVGLWRSGLPMRTGSKILKRTEKEPQRIATSVGQRLQTARDHVTKSGRNECRTPLRSWGTVGMRSDYSPDSGKNRCLRTARILGIPHTQGLRYLARHSCFGTQKPRVQTGC